MTRRLSLPAGSRSTDLDSPRCAQSSLQLGINEARNVRLHELMTSKICGIFRISYWEFSIYDTGSFPSRLRDSPWSCPCAPDRRRYPRHGLRDSPWSCPCAPSSLRGMPRIHSHPGKGARAPSLRGRADPCVCEPRSTLSPAKPPRPRPCEACRAPAWGRL